MKDDDSKSELRSTVESMMTSAWTEPGFCVPNRITYPYQWLWDSCFHSIIWAELGDARCMVELQNVLANQHISGFVPHMTYWGDPDAHADFWGVSGMSSITQPPMYGHTLAELTRRGFTVAPSVASKARAGLRYLLSRPRTAAGLVPVWHPWETGCDNSARWDDWVPGGTGFDFDRWRVQKSAYVQSLSRDSDDAVQSSDFEVGSVGFNALTAWNIHELASVGESDAHLDSSATDLTRAVCARWKNTLGTWTDSEHGSGQARTLDAMLGSLVDPRSEVFDALIDPNAFGAPFGPRGTHIEEPTYDPNEYWRGPAWPQLSYLLYLAARRVNHNAAPKLANQFVAGAAKSGLAEFWNPENGEGRGAMPQSWAGLALCVS